MIQRAREFQNELARFANISAPEAQKAVHERIHLEALRGVVLLTPVDQGTYNEDGDRIRSAANAGVTRGNWQSTIGQPATGTTDRSDKGGGAVIAEGAAVVATMQPGGVSWITNNSPNIEVLENGGYPNPPKNPGFNVSGQPKTEGGFSRQAPRGMLKVTVNRIRSGLGL